MFRQLTHVSLPTYSKKNYWESLLTFASWLAGKPRLAEHIVKLGGLNTKLTIDSKIAWSGNGDGSMTLDAISQSVEGSLAAIGNDKVRHSEIVNFDTLPRIDCFPSSTS
jgi:hypothetical protein